MVFKVICLLFYIVDMFLTVIDVTRAFIVSHLKLAAGKSVDNNNSRYEVYLNLHFILK